jgi:hypothetical protein
MADRVKPREVVQDADGAVLTSFAGLADGSTSIAGDSVQSHKLVNTFVNRSGELEQRPGTSAKLGLQWTNTGKTTEVFAFQFDGCQYSLAKTGNQLTLFFIDVDANGVRFYSRVSYKDNVFRSASDSEPTTMTQVVDGNLCYILIATKSTQLIAFTLVAYSTTVVTKTGTSQITFSLQDYPNVNVLAYLNCSAITSDGKYAYKATSVSQSGANVTYNTNVGEIQTLGVGDPIKFHAYFWMRCADASYYPGFYLWGVSTRRNSVALDVNVQVPFELSDNPLLNESSNNGLGGDILSAIKYTTSPPTLYSRVYTEQPNTEDTFELSDGGYISGSGNKVVRSLSHIAFGALQAGGAVTRVYMARAREIVLASRSSPNISNLLAYVDKLLYATVNYRNDSYSPIGSGNAKYFSLDSNGVPGVTPGLKGSSVVELVYTANGAGSGASNNVCDLTQGAGTIAIGDGYVIPLYGYNQLADTLRHRYPNIVASVGNRVILTGLDNRVGVSNADWSYRGVSFSNFQVSTIDFNDTSAYQVVLGSGASVVYGATSVNGVIIVATDVGIFRIAGSGATSAPTASQANVAKVSSEIVPNNYCFVVFDNKVYYSSSTGFYQLQYAQEVDELSNESWSTLVNKRWNSGDPTAVSYSKQCRAFLLGFSDRNSLLAFNIDSLTWSEFKFATSARPHVNKTFDGVTFETLATEEPFDENLLVNEFDSSTVDFNGLGIWFTGALPGLSTVITESDTDVSGLMTPSELLSILDSRVLSGYGENTARCKGVASVTITEATDTIEPKPIVSAMVSKTFIGDKIGASNRVRGFSLVTNGSGTIDVLVHLPTDDYDDVQLEHNSYSLGLTNEYTGEGLLNAQYSQRSASLTEVQSTQRKTRSDVINIRTRVVGIAEAWQMCLKFSSGLRVVGFQFDTSRKGGRRLH